MNRTIPPNRSRIGCGRNAVAAAFDVDASNLLRLLADRVNR